MIKHRIYVAVTAATVAVPASSGGIHPAGWHLVGIALYIAERDHAGHWRFARRAHAIPAGEPESALLDWATARLPDGAILIGWHVDHMLVPALLDAAATAPPTIAQRFIAQLHRVLRGGVVDVALKYGGAGAPPLAVVATDMAIYAPAWDADKVIGAWAIGSVDQLRHDLADEALALWRIFVRTAGVAGLKAEAQTDAWVLRRQGLRVVDRAAAPVEQQEQEE